MTVLVFGTTGQVATELRAQAPVTALGRAQADLSDPAACAAAIHAHRPRAVINAAAHTAVDRAESEEDLATIINAGCPRRDGAVLCSPWYPLRPDLDRLCVHR